MGEFPSVFHPWDGCKFHPPTWHIQLAGLPIQPGFNIYDRGVWGVTFSTLFGVWFNLRFLEGHPPPLSRPTRGPQSSVQRATSWATPTTAMEWVVAHLSSPGSISQCHFRAPEWPLMPFGKPPWPPRGLPHVSLPFS